MLSKKRACLGNFVEGQMPVDNPSGFIFSLKSAVEICH